MTLRTTISSTALAAAGITAAAMALGSFEPPKSHDAQLGRASLVAADADNDLKLTVVGGAISQPLEKGKNLLWCGTFQYAWNELGNVMNGAPGPLTVAEAPRLAEWLNAGKTSTADLDADSYVAMGGFGRDGILDRVRSALQKTFKGAASPKLLPSSLGPDEILAYAYLFKNLEFETPFVKSKVALTFGDAKLKAFGLWDDHEIQDWFKIQHQIHVLAYQDPTHWLVELDSKSSQDRLLFARLDPRESLERTVAGAMDMAQGEAEQKFNRDDTLKVAMMNFDVTRNFRELVGKGVSGSKHSGNIAFAKQNIRLKLDERGAILKSEGAIGVTAAAPIRPRQPKIMICDGPFLMVMMRRDAANPYFAAWIDNAELLDQWK